MYNHAPENYTCPFCLLIRGVEHERVYSVESDIVYRDEFVTAFLSSHQWPRNPGNTIVVPNEHFENIFDLPEKYAIPIQHAARRVALAMKAAFACQGVSLRQHNESAGYQDVWHYHLHVTPRFVDDQLYSTYMDRALMPVERRAELAIRLKRCLDSQSGG
jgi:histidine triad (HIT) family protein